MNLKDASDEHVAFLASEAGLRFAGPRVWELAIDEYSIREIQKEKAKRQKALEEARWSWENGGRQRSRIAWPLVLALFVGGCWLALAAQSAWPVFAAVLAFFFLMAWADGPRKPH